MSTLLKKFLTVAIALVIGLTVVFFAWRANVLQKNSVSFEPTISGDSWKDSLLVVPSASSSKVLGEAQKNSAVATTTTDLVARELLVNYAVLQQSTGTTTLSDADAQALASKLAKNIQTPQGISYSIKNISVSNDNSNSAFTLYLKEVNDAMKTFVTIHKTNEITIITDAVKTKDSSKLKPLSSIISQYRNLQKNLLLIPAPSSIAPLHLRLVQSYSDTEASIVGMQRIITDPVIGLTSLEQYRKASADIESTAAEYQNYSPAQ